ncbi:DUF3467 domain-containing protein [bacterium]|nr:DUF3467 domain-containing protein [bacterium]
MPEDQGQKPTPGAPAEGQQARLHVRDWDTKTSYANVCMLSSTAEEMILNFGMSFPMPKEDKPRDAELLVTNRVIMGLPAAKRLAVAVSQAIQRYENAFGVIDIQPRKPAGQPSGGAPASN